MRLLLDTHAYVWWANGDSHLSLSAKMALSAGDLYVSPVVFWEITTKQRTKGWPEGARPLDDAVQMIVDGMLHHLPITLDHARRAGSIASSHRDPFDRMLAAQASLEGLTVVTRDPAFRTLGCETIW